MLRTRTRALSESALCLLILAVIPLIMLHPIILRGEVPISTDSIFAYPPWEQARPADIEPAPGQGQDALANRFYPWYAFLNDSALRGDSLLWNPLEACGLPFFALWRTRCLSPFSIPFYLFNLDTAFQVSAILKLLVAGLAAYFVARRLGFDKPIALFVGVAIQSGGHVLLWLNWPLSDTIVWLPILIVVVERFRMGQFRVWPLGAVVFGLMLTGGDPQAVAGALLYSAIYLTARRILNPRGDGPALAPGLGMLAAVCALGAALLAVQLAPFIEFVRSAATTGRQLSEPDIGLTDLVVSFLPGFLGGFGPAIAGHGTGDSPQTLGMLYVGLGQLVLLPLWLAVRRSAEPRQRNRVEAFLIAAVTMTVLATVARPLLGYVPLLNTLGPRHLLAANALSLTLVAAAAAEEWIELDAASCAKAIRRFLVAAPAVVGVGVVLVVLNLDRPRPGAAPLAGQVAVAVGMAMALLGLTAVTLLRPSVRVMGYGLAALALVDLFVTFQPGIPFANQDALFPSTPFMAVLKETDTRVCGSAALHEWPVSGNLAPQAHGTSGVLLKRQAAFFEKADEDPVLLRRTGSPNLLLTKSDIQGAFAAVRPGLRVKQVFSWGAVLFEDVGTTPRAWVTHEARLVRDFNPDDLSVNLPPLVERIVPPEGSAAASTQVEIIPPEKNAYVVVQVELEEPGLLVLADTWYPGWKAWVNNERAEIGIVDGIFRGMALEPGQHRVVFSYDPWSLKLGMAVSVVAALFVMAALVRLLLEWRRNRQQWPTY